MNDPYEQNPNHNAPGEFTQQFGNFGNTHEQPYTPVSGPPTSYDGVGFWYRPEPQDVYFHHHSATTTQAPSNIAEPNIAVKHRRTRSGCFTCRSRRVKCDETRPICDRCRKGNRECVFPQASSGSKRSKDDATGDQGPTSPRENRRSSAATLGPIQDVSDEDELELSPHSPTFKSATELSKLDHRLRKHKHRQQAYASREDRSPTPSEADSVPSRDLASPERTMSFPNARLASRWSKLKSVEQSLLQFQHNHMTHYQYFLRVDTTDFIHDTLIHLALNFEPLLSAVLAFAAYHQQIRSSDGEFTVFWHYYCRSIVQLRKWLEDNGERNEAVLLTILQLAMFEEYLGDWANLVSHHRAAHSIVLSMYSSDTIMKTETSRIIFDWFARLDVCASLMANIPAALDRQWLLTAVAWHQARYDAQDLNIENALEYFHAHLRLVGHDMACAYASVSPTTSFEEEAAAISARLKTIGVDLQALHDLAVSSEGLTRHSSRTSEDAKGAALDRHTPTFTHDLWPLNYIWLDFYGAQQMHIFQSARILHRQSQQSNATTAQPASEESAANLAGSMSAKLNQLSLAQCQGYEAIEQWSPSSAAGATTLGSHISMAFSTIFLSHEPKYITWARQKLAAIESMGYIWPTRFRTTMAQIWDAPDIVDWWLPNGEGKPSLVDEIRTVVSDRTKENAEKGVDDGKDAFREFKAIFDGQGIGILAGLDGVTSTSSTFTTTTSSINTAKNLMSENMTDVNVNVDSDPTSPGNPSALSDS